MGLVGMMPSLPFTIVAAATEPHRTLIRLLLSLPQPGPVNFSKCVENTAVVVATMVEGSDGEGGDCGGCNNQYGIPNLPLVSLMFTLIMASAATTAAAATPQRCRRR